MGCSARRCQPWLGTYVEVAAQAPDEAVLERAIQSAFDSVARVHRLMSFHDPASDVSRLNRHASHSPVTVDAWTHEVLGEAQRMHLLSGGIFDVAIAPSLIAWGFLPDKHVPTEGRGTTAEVDLMTKRRVRFHRSLTLDLGGIAKGFAVDRAVEALQAAGISSGSVNAGGDLRVFGPRPQPLRVRHPGQPTKTLVVGELRDEAAATSAACFSRRRHAGRWVSPILDPFTARPWLGRASITVIAPSCLQADALTKIIALAPEGAPAILTDCGARAIIVADAKPSNSRLMCGPLSPCTLAA